MSTRPHKIHPDALTFALVAMGVLGCVGVLLLVTGKCFPEF